jgi:hypothetical protein
MADLTHRQHYALHGSWGPVPLSFEHTPAPGKPLSPNHRKLEGLALMQVEGWLFAFLHRQSSIYEDLPSLEKEAQEKIAEYRKYFDTTAYKKWKAIDDVYRDSLWRLHRADHHHAIETATRPPSAPAG